MDPRIRYALYYTPRQGSPLAVFGAGIVGYDSATGEAVPHPTDLPGLADVTTAPRVYGFHATLSAPMRLREGAAEADVIAAAAMLAQAHPPVRVGPLAVTLIGGFCALTPVEPTPGVDLLAAEAVAAMDPLRARLSEDERARRRPERLDPRRRALLDRWGYPHVFEAFRFHMTLTGSLPEDVRHAWRERLAAACPAIGPLVIDAITLLRQEGEGPFRVLRRCPFDV